MKKAIANLQKIANEGAIAVVDLPVG